MLWVSGAHLTLDGPASSIIRQLARSCSCMNADRADSSCRLRARFAFTVEPCFPCLIEAIDLVSPVDFVDLVGTDTSHVVRLIGEKTVSTV